MAANPYLEAHREWDERYADLVLGKRNWQIAAGGLLAVSLTLAAGIVWLSTRSRYVPYVVEARIERYEVASFIRDARAVSSDPQVEQQMLNSLLGHARGAADRFLDAYYHSDSFAHNPFKLAERLTISVQIDSILSVSSQSYQVRWTEVQHDLNGVLIGAPTHWEALLQTQVIPPGNEDAIISNPLGFYVTQISWTEQQG